jgi:hypothetical protein
MLRPLAGPQQIGIAFGWAVLQITEGPEQRRLCQFAGKRSCAGVILVLLGVAVPLGIEASELPRISACYERIYDGRHLAAHPQQKVRRMRASYIVIHGDVQVHLDVWLRGNPIHYSMYADCVKEERGQRCKTEHDENSWRVDATPAGGLLVTNGDIWINPDAADSQTRLPEGLRLTAEPDDRSWMLYRLNACHSPSERRN